jgi:processive 1,2-diacylglycerol beta-glucosyltransferase
VSKVLVTYAFSRSGHHAAAKAIVSALKAADPLVEVNTLDYFRCMSPRWGRFVETTYLAILKRMPWLWNLLYDCLLAERLTKAWQRSGHSRNHTAPPCVDAFGPDVVICTQACPFLFFSSLSAQGRIHATVLGVLTDFVPHRLWIGEDHARYVVPTVDAADRLHSLGIPAERIRTIGIPINVYCSRETSGQADSPGRVVMVMGGSFGLNLSCKTVRLLDASPADFSIHVICGLNARLRRTLSKASASFKHPVHVWGYLNDIPARMCQSSVVVTKPGGMTSAEALALQVPLVLLPPLPGQEHYNRDFLVKSQAAIATTLGSLEKTATTLLNNPVLLDSMHARAGLLGRPKAAHEIAEYVLRDLLSQSSVPG